MVGDVDGRRAKKEAASARFQEVDVVGIAGLHDEAQLVAQFAGAAGKAQRDPASAASRGFPVGLAEA